MHTIVVGGGFAGIKAALEISRRGLGRVTLISERDYFLHHGSVYAVATGHAPDAAVFALDDIFAAHPDVTVMNARMTSIDPERKLVVCGKKSYGYDNLVLALGSESKQLPSSYKDHVFDVRNREQIIRLHSHIRDAIINDHHVDRSYVIVGGGPTGVELAGALQEYIQKLTHQHLAKRVQLRVTIAESSSRLLPMASKEASKHVERRLRKLGVHVATNSTVTLRDDKFITLGGRKVPIETVIWTSHFKAHSFYKQHPHYFDVAASGLVKVNPYLEAYRDVYVLGDNVDGYSAGIRSALDMGEFIADYLWRRATGRLLAAYRPSNTPLAVSVGDSWSYVEVLGVYLTGSLADVLRRRIIYSNYRQIMSRTMADIAMHAHSAKKIAFSPLRKT